MLSAWRRLRQTQRPGWLAVAPAGDCARVAQVLSAPDQRPRVGWVDTLDWREPAVALRALARRPRTAAHTVAVLPTGAYQLLALDAPELPRDEWRDALRWRVKEIVDFPVEDAAIDVFDAPADPQQRRRPGVFVVAAARAAVMPLVRAGQAARRPWQAVDIAETALRNIALLAAEPGRGEALLHAGERSSTLVLVAQGELLLSRVIDVSFAQLTDTDDQQRQLAFERASLELQRTFDNVERQFTHADLRCLRLLPGAALAPFAAYVRELIYLPVFPLDLGSVVDIDGVPELATAAGQAAYLTAVGAALR